MGFISHEPRGSTCDDGGSREEEDVTIVLERHRRLKAKEGTATKKEENV